MTWLTEDPTAVIVLGAITIALLAIVFFNTGRAAVLFGMFGTILLVGLLVLAEHLIVTDRERVEMTVYDVAKSLEANDLADVQSYLAADATRLHNQAVRYMSMVELQEVHITDGPDITVNKLTTTPTAHVDLVAVPHHKLKSGASGRQQIPLEVKLKLRLTDNRWLIDSAEIIPFNPSNR